MYTEYLNKNYLNTKHSAIESTPRERFMKDYELIKRKNNEEIEECFLHKVVRLVRTDGTISLNNMIYEVPQQYIKKYITIKYNPEDLKQLYIYNDKNEKIHVITSVDKISNSKYKRQNLEEVTLYREETK